MKKIKNIGRTKRLIDPDLVAKELGAEKIGERPANTGLTQKRVALPHRKTGVKIKVLLSYGEELVKKPVIAKTYPKKKYRDSFTISVVCARIITDDSGPGKMTTTGHMVLEIKGDKQKIVEFLKELAMKGVKIRLNCDKPKK